MGSSFSVALTVHMNLRFFDLCCHAPFFTSEKTFPVPSGGRSDFLLGPLLFHPPLETGSVKEEALDMMHRRSPVHRRCPRSLVVSPSQVLLVLLSSWGGVRWGTAIFHCVRLIPGLMMVQLSLLKVVWQYSS